MLVGKNERILSRPINRLDPVEFNNKFQTPEENSNGSAIIAKHVLQ